MRTGRRASLTAISDEQFQEMAHYCRGEVDILALYLYGSLGTPYQTPLSDVDLALLPVDGPRWDIHRELDVSAELTRIAQSDDVTMVNFRSVPVTLQMRTLETGRPIFISDPGALKDFTMGVIMRYADFAPDLAAFYRDWDCAIREAYL